MGSLQLQIQMFSRYVLTNIVEGTIVDFRTLLSVQVVIHLTICHHIGVLPYVESFFFLVTDYVHCCNYLTSVYFCLVGDILGQYTLRYLTLDYVSVSFI